MRPVSRLLTLFVAVLWTLGGAAAPASAAPALWQVSDGDSDIYLFGSVHLMDKGRQWRTPQFEAVLEAAEHVYFEVLLDADGYATITRLSMIYSHYRDGRTLWDDLTPEQADRLRREAPRYGLRVESLASLRPWVVAQALTMSTLSDTPTTELMMSGVDMALQAEVAPERQRQLETAEIQFRLLSGAPIEEQVTTLMNTLDGLGQLDGRDPLEELLADWSRGDTDALAQTVFAEMPVGTGEYRRYFSDRNRRWVTELEKLLASNDKSLIVVGAGHLVGPDGLPALLEQAGYTVKRIDGGQGAATAAPSPFAVTRR